MIGQRIKEARKKLGLTQEQLAAGIFISDSYMTLIEQGKRSMSVDILDKLSKRLGVTADYILNGDSGSAEEQLAREWGQIVRGRSEEEVRAAHDAMKAFFACLDRVKG